LKRGVPHLDTKMYYDYWREFEPPTNHAHDVMPLFEGRFIPEIRLTVAQYEGGAWCCTSHVWNTNHSNNVTAHLRAQGRLLPVENAGYPEYYEDYVEYKRYSTIELGPRKALLASIQGGYETMRAKKILNIIGRQGNYPEDCIQIIKEFLLKVPRNRAFH